MLEQEETELTEQGIFFFETKAPLAYQPAARIKISYSFNRKSKI